MSCPNSESHYSEDEYDTPDSPASAVADGAWINATPNPAGAERIITSTITNTIAQFTDFLVVAIHTILYEREIYPRDLFLSKRVYNHPVPQCRHPGVCKWILDVVELCMEKLIEVQAHTKAI